MQHSSAVETTDDDRRMTHTHTMRRLSNDHTHYATAVGCTHDDRQQFKLIANLADIVLYQEEEEEEDETFSII